MLVEMMLVGVVVFVLIGLDWLADSRAAAAAAGGAGGVRDVAGSRAPQPVARSSPFAQMGGALRSRRR